MLMQPNRASTMPVIQATALMIAAARTKPPGNYAAGVAKALAVPVNRACILWGAVDVWKLFRMLKDLVQSFVPSVHSWWCHSPPGFAERCR